MSHVPGSKLVNFPELPYTVLVFTPELTISCQMYNGEKN